MAVIVILALVALFIGLRLYSVLGERTGHEQQPILKPADSEPRAAAPVTQPAAPQAAPAEAGDMAFVPTAGPGVRAIVAADQTFDVARFLEGAKSAYRMILEAFWKGDLSALKGHVDEHVLAAFEGAVEQRNKDGVTLDNRLVAIEQAVISEAALERGVAVITVRFEADIAAVTRNAEGQVIAGSLSDAVQTRDLWTFRRDTSSRDPNWLLIETDEEE
ncbi:MAG TPA: Tim44/TimA family putative adaptor protein [Sphingomicrobium sp.]|nr:Tim44/TimA family putative adaptor protein [Sphingomicrobium sp.]